MAPLESKLDSLQAEIDAIKGEKAKASSSSGNSSLSSLDEEKIIKILTDQHEVLWKRAGQYVSESSEKMLNVTKACDELIKDSKVKIVPKPSQVWISTEPVLPRVEANSEILELIQKNHSLSSASLKASFEKEELKLKMGLLLKDSSKAFDNLDKDIEVLLQEELQENGESATTKKLEEFIAARKKIVEEADAPIEINLTEKELQEVAEYREVKALDKDKVLSSDEEVKKN